jgi:hypothetical protein
MDERQPWDREPNCCTLYGAHKRCTAWVIYLGKVWKMYFIQKLANVYSRSVHNVHIEQLWVDFMAQIGATWADYFTILELCHGLNINNINHIWLFHLLFLTTINQQLSFFAESWNQHHLQIHNGPN